jgi:hypothetical protein
MGAPAPRVPLTGVRAASRRSSRRVVGGMASAPRRSSSAGRWGVTSNTMGRERGVDENEKMWTRMDGPISDSCGGE